MSDDMSSRVPEGQITSEQDAVWRFRWDCGRMGDVEGVFIASKSEIEASIGKHVSFGEILGKHSDVYGTLDKEDLTMISDNPEVVKVVREHGLTSGYNPFDYMGE